MNTEETKEDVILKNDVENNQSRQLSQEQYDKFEQVLAKIQQIQLQLEARLQEANVAPEPQKKVTFSVPEEKPAQIYPAQKVTDVKYPFFRIQPGGNPDF